MRLENKVAIITGSSRGMGKATAILFAREGAKVVVNYLNNKERADQVLDEIKKAGGIAIAIQADISKPADVKRLFRETVAAFGTVDILVNNAGVVSQKPFFDLTVEDIQKMLDTNLLGTVLCAQEAGRIMLEKKYGKIINIASVSGLEHFGRPATIAYAMSKAAVINFTGVLAKTLAPYVNVNGIAPGVVETEIAATLSADYKEKVLREAYLKRFVKPEEIANTSLFLASDDSSALTGEVIVVDAGFQLK